MTTINPSTIIEELNADNGTNYKLEILKKHKDNALFTRVLKMAYDKVTHTYGITLKNIDQPPFDSTKITMHLEEALDMLDELFVTRTLTGNDAHNALLNILNSLPENEADIIRRIIDRDLKINLGRTQINKVHKNLIVKPVYMRCSILTDKNQKKVKFPALINLKADGTYREVTVENGNVTYNSRSGEQYDYPVLTETFVNYPDGKYIGELTVRLDEILLEKILPTLRKLDTKNGTSLEDEIVNDFKNGKLILPRHLGNGLINSDDVPHNNIMCEVWDYVNLPEYTNAANRVKNTTKYVDRWEALKNIVREGDQHVQLIEAYVVNDLEEAMHRTQNWMEAGLEGSILKNMDAVFRDGTSTEQWKMKLIIEVDVRITGFIEGKKGTKREDTFGSMTFETDDGKIKGSVSGFTDDQLTYFNSRRQDMIGQIMTVECNDITKGRTHDYHALSHPRFTEIRYDKDTTDTLERVFEMKELAMKMKQTKTQK